MRKCSKCLRDNLTNDDFYKTSGNRCKECMKSYTKNYKKQNLDKYKQWRGVSRDRAKQDMLDAYGHECACCGESEIGFLSLDHIDTNGAKERRDSGRKGGYVFYAWLRLNGWPDGYQVLCYNCNCARYYLGECPHVKIQAVVR